MERNGREDNVTKDQEGMVIKENPGLYLNMNDITMIIPATYW